MNTIKAFAIVTLAGMWVATSQAQDAEPESKAEVKREEIDTTAKETLDTLFEEYPASKELFDKSYGYAVFDNFKLALLIASERGRGVAVQKSSGDRIYMRMGSLGVNVGLGGQKMQVVFLFEDEKTFNRFVNKGWKADAGADAAAGTQGASADLKFVRGMATFQFTEKGLMAQANRSGTKYWKDKKLN